MEEQKEEEEDDGPPPPLPPFPPPAVRLDPVPPGAAGPWGALAGAYFFLSGLGRMLRLRKFSFGELQRALVPSVATAEADPAAADNRQLLADVHCALLHTVIGDWARRTALSTLAPPPRPPLVQQRAHIFNGRVWAARSFNL